MNQHFTTLIASVLGPMQWLIILAVILLLFGANRLPDLMRSLGRSVTEFKKGINEGGDDDDKPPDKLEKP